MDTKHTLHMRHDKDGNVRPEAIGSHTPGPWKQYRDSRGNVRIQGNVAGGPVAFIEEMNNTGGTPQDHANARLIAAAPELLEELSKLANKVFGYGHGEPSDSAHHRTVGSIGPQGEGGIFRTRVQHRPRLHQPIIPAPWTTQANGKE